jgi:hypothetical protein
VFGQISMFGRSILDEAYLGGKVISTTEFLGRMKVFSVTLKSVALSAPARTLTRVGVTGER